MSDIFWLLIIFTNGGYANDTISLKFDTEIECNASMDAILNKIYGGPNTWSAPTKSNRFCIKVDTTKYKK